MARRNPDIEVIVRYVPDMECQIRALLIMLGDGKAHQPAPAATVEEREQRGEQEEPHGS